MDWKAIKHNARVGLVCLSLSTNAITAGAIFCFPLFADSLAEHLRLTQPQLTTIVLAGMMGQYPFAAFVGWIVDYYGPWLCSLIASVFFAFSFGLFAREISHTPPPNTDTSGVAYRLTFCFFIAGLGAVFSLFSAMFAATRTLPRYPGFASGASLALYGLSPLFLSLIASTWFTDPETGLNVSRFLGFQAFLSGTVHLLGSIALRAIPSPAEPMKLLNMETSETLEPDEHSLLLPPSSSQVAPGGDGSVRDLLRDPGFWALCGVLMATLGPCEMIMSNIGTIASSLPASTAASAGIASTQVRILSFTNTIIRFLVGPLADYLSPVSLFAGTASVKKRPVSRVVFLIASTALLALTLLITELFVRSQRTLWILTVGTGLVYGSIFTLLSSILAAIWGHENSGRNFGIVTYAIFLGTPIFSYLYAFGSDTGGAGVCRGVQCWRVTFWVVFACTAMAVVGSIWLWRRWRTRV